MFPQFPHLLHRLPHCCKILPCKVMCVESTWLMHIVRGVIVHYSVHQTIDKPIGKHLLGDTPAWPTSIGAISWQACSMCWPSTGSHVTSFKNSLARSYQLSSFNVAFTFHRSSSSKNLVRSPSLSNLTTSPLGSLLVLFMYEIGRSLMSEIMVRIGFRKLVHLASVYDIQQPLVCKRALRRLYYGQWHLSMVI